MNYEVIEIQILGLEEHALSKNHPLMTDEQFQSLKEDIKLNGQLEPIRLYKGKIIDGRHRVRALNEIAKDAGEARKKGREGGVVKCQSIKNNTTLDEVKALINSTETRRMQTVTQLTVSAFKMALTDPDLKYREAALIKGVKVDAVSKCKRIYQKMGLDVIDTLIAGGEITITDQSGVMKKSSSVQFIYNTLGKIEKKESERKHNYSLTQFDAQRFAREDLGMRCKSKKEARMYLRAVEDQVMSMLED